MTAVKSGKKKSNPEDQYHKFVDAARALECDESEQRFNEVLGKIVRAESVDKPLEKPTVEKPKP